MIIAFLPLKYKAGLAAGDAAGNTLVGHRSSPLWEDVAKGLAVRPKNNRPLALMELVMRWPPASRDLLDEA